MRKMLTSEDNQRYLICESKNDITDEIFHMDEIDGIKIYNNRHHNRIYCPYINPVDRTYTSSKECFFYEWYMVEMYKTEYIYHELNSHFAFVDFSNEKRPEDCPPFVFKTIDEAVKVFKELELDTSYYFISKDNIADMVNRSAREYKMVFVCNDEMDSTTEEEGDKLEEFLYQNTFLEDVNYEVPEIYDGDEPYHIKEINYIKEHPSNLYRADYIYICNYDTEEGKLFEECIQSIMEKDVFRIPILNHFFKYEK